MAASETSFLIAGEKTVAVPGTAEQLVAASKRAKSITIIAKPGNTGVVYLGGTDVASSTNGGLAAGVSLSMEAVGWMDLTEIYLDVGTADDGVDFWAIKA